MEALLEPTSGTGSYLLEGVSCSSVFILPKGPVASYLLRLIADFELSRPELVIVSAPASKGSPLCTRDTVVSYHNLA
jgi:hypothetical protein